MSNKVRNVKKKTIYKREEMRGKEERGRGR
jgi:hypothetical protein